MILICSGHYFKIFQMVQVFLYRLPGSRAQGANRPKKMPGFFGKEGVCVDTLGLNSDMVKKHVKYQGKEGRETERQECRGDI